MGGSQLTQLKAALHSTGLAGERRKKKTQKGGQRKSGSFVDEDARKAKLEAIRQSMNRFDVKTTKTKHSVLGAKPAKGSTGRPGLSKQTGLENRRKTLLPQWLDRNRAGAVVDRRFGEDDPTMTPEEKALQRFTFERQRKASKSSLFTLNDNDDDEDNGSVPLTHYGQNLSDVRGALADQEDLFHKSKTSRTIPELEEVMPDADSTQRRKKTKAEVMEEVMAKSKAYKYERQREKHVDEEMRHALDDELAGIRNLLGAPNRRQEPSRDVFLRADPAPSATSDKLEADPPAPVASTSKTTLTFVKPDETAPSVDRSLLAGLLGETEDVPVSDEPRRPQPQIHPSRSGNLDDVLASLPRFDRRDQAADEKDLDEEDSDPYDRFVRELAFEKRAAPSDRLKSEAEAALEAAETLRRSEAARLKRMQGEEDSEEDENPSLAKRASKTRDSARRPEGDDLDDDYGLDGDEVGGFTLGLGSGLEGETQEGEEDSQEDSESLDINGTDNGEDDDENDDQSSESEASADDLAETELLADLLHRDAEVKGLNSDDETENQSGVTAASVPDSRRRKDRSSKVHSLPFTFPCPENHEQFLNLLAGHEDKLPTVVDRIRTLYHPSLGEGNKEKLASFLGVLIDHIVYEASDASHVRHLAYLSSQISTLSYMFPVSSASFFIAKLKIMQRNLLLGLQAGPALPTSKTWPGAGEVVLLRLTGLIWSTSDFAHPVSTAASLLIAQYLAQCRVRHLVDLTAGLFLCSISTQYEAFSKRLVPEVVNFLSVNIPALILGDGTQPEGETISFTSSSIQKMVVVSATVQHSRPDILDIMCHGQITEATREQICLLAIELSAETYSRQTSLPSFEECFMPLTRALAEVAAAIPASPLKDRVATVQDGLERAMRLARAARRPLTLQSHKPVPIPTFIPKFEASYAPGRKFDPDSARNEAAKLKALVKKERKGAIRELRKDSRFLAGERAKMQAEKDREYKGKIDKITAGLQEERHEEKRFERTKEREKLRDLKQSGGGRRK